nr:hypothetical protein CFP56_08062 [Quercus suber]
MRAARGVGGGARDDVSRVKPRYALDLSSSPSRGADVGNLNMPQPSVPTSLHYASLPLAQRALADYCRHLLPHCPVRVEGPPTQCLRAVVGSHCGVAHAVLRLG